MQKGNEQITDEVKDDAPAEEKDAPSADEPEAASPGSGQESAPNQEEVNTEQEAKAATVIQSNFRGYKERKRLQEEGQLPAKDQKETDPQTQDQEEQGSEEKTAEETSTTQEEPEKEKEPTEPSSEGQNGEDEKTEEVRAPESKRDDEEQAQREKNDFESFSKHVSRRFLQTGEDLEQSLRLWLIGFGLNPGNGTKIDHFGGRGSNNKIILNILMLA